MAPRPWTVLEHSAIEVIDDNLWGVVSPVPDFPKGTGMDRRMSIVRLADGRLVFHNAVPLNEESLARVSAWGKPSILIVPMHLHMIDAHAFREKLGLEVFTSRAAVDKVREAVPVSGTLENLVVDPSLQCEPLAGTKFGEAAWVVKSGPRASLLLCDAIQNSRPGKGFGAFMFKLMGFTGAELNTPPFYKLRAVSDRAALKRDLLRLAETPGLARLVPSHGEIVDTDAAGALRNTVSKYL
ncbi:MAG TPA: hypothetical protein VGM44_20290 [Polyangiaceae bacterium]|jgi:hypothetical protein